MSKVEVLSVGNAWTPPNRPDADPMYTLIIKGQGEPVKTYDKKLATVGEHEAESYQSKSGKTYWRIAEPASEASSESYSKHDMLEIAKNQSIQRQVAVKGAVELTYSGIAQWDDFEMTFDRLMRLLSRPWKDNGNKDKVPTAAEIEALEQAGLI